MPDTETPDHDQRLKVLLKEFFEQFFQCFFAKWADTYERGKLEGKIEGLRETATMLLNDRFGPLSQAELHRVTELTLDQLQGLLARIVRANSLEELNLTETPE